MSIVIEGACQFNFPAEWEAWKSDDLGILKNLRKVSSI